MNFNITSLEFVLVHSDVSNIISKLHHRHLIVLVAGCLFYRSGIMWIIYLLVVVLLTTTILIQQHAATSVITHNTNARDMLTIFCCFQYFTSCCLKLSFTCNDQSQAIISSALIQWNYKDWLGAYVATSASIIYFFPKFNTKCRWQHFDQMCPFAADIISIQVMETFAMFHVS